MYRIRDKEYPSRPKTDEDIQTTFNNPDIFEEYGKSLNGQHQFYVGSDVNENYAFHVFASFDTIDLIEKYIVPDQRNYLMDGTFKIAPSKFQQLLIISIEYKNDVSIFFVKLTLNHTTFCKVFKKVHRGSLLKKLHYVCILY